MKLSVEGRTAQLILNQPQTRNSFGLPQADQLLQFLSQLANQDIAAILLRSGQSGYFSAGGNLDEQASIPSRAEGILYHRRIRQAVTALAKLPVPIVIGVQGLCLGGGLELMSCADHVVASPQALFGFWQKRVGLTFGWGGGRRLRKRMTRSQILNLALGGRTISAAVARELNLIDEVAPDWAVEERCRAWIHLVTENSEINPEWKKWTAKAETSIFESLLWRGRHLELLKRRQSRIRNR